MRFSHGSGAPFTIPSEPTIDAWNQCGHRRVINKHRAYGKACYVRTAMPELTQKSIEAFRPRLQHQVAHHNSTRSICCSLLLQCRTYRLDPYHNFLRTTSPINYWKVSITTHRVATASSTGSRFGNGTDVDIRSATCQKKMGRMRK